MLYHKYRPKKFEEIHGQEVIVETLQNALKQGRVGQAYLFAGPRGTGKTSLARILAQELGVEELDLIEIDAASNRGIDEVRALREQVNFLPASGDKKLYILDEAHMLTPEAANALLKTLEEPPEHVHFVLCTTEPYKLPLTIISRCQRFDFALADESILAEYLAKIAQLEKVKLEQEALRLLAEVAGGSFRDGLVLLEKLILAGGKGVITAEQAGRVIGLPHAAQVEKLIGFLAQKKTSEALNLIEELNQQGVEMKGLTEAMIKKLRRALREKLGAGSSKSVTSAGHFENNETLIDLIVRLIEVSREIKNSPVPSLPLEILVAEWGGGGDSGSTPNPRVRFSETRVGSEDTFPETSLGRALARRALDSDSSQPQAGARLRKVSEKGTLRVGGQRESFTRVSPASLEDVDTGAEGTRLDSSLKGFWPKVLELIKPHNHSVEALLKGCEPLSFENDILTLRFFYPFHKERIEDSRNRRLVEEVASEVLGQKVRVRCVLGSNDTSGNASGNTRLTSSQMQAPFTRLRQAQGSAALRAQSLAEVPLQRSEKESYLSDRVEEDGGEQDLMKLAQEVLGGEIIE